MAETTRGRSRILRDQIAIAWIVAALVIVLTHRFVPDAIWLMIHLVLLGALTHSALVWSEHFAHTLLRRPPDAKAITGQNVRIVLLAVGALSVFLGHPFRIWQVVLAGAALITVAVLWHAVHLVGLLRDGLPTRFRIVTHYYIAASLCLPVGAGFGVTMSSGVGERLHGQLLVAHITLNMLGWIGLTITGTLVTFWPTLLRARMDSRAERFAAQALPGLIAAIVIVVTGAAVGVEPIVIAGLGLYLLFLIHWSRALVVPLRAQGLREFAPASVLCALVWAFVGLVALGVILVATDRWAAVTAAGPRLAAIFAVGTAAQLLTGALSYLVPSVMGGGPSVVRAAQAHLNRFATWRLVTINLGLIVWFLPAPSWARITVSVLVAVALAMFLPLLVLGVRASVRAKREAEERRRHGERVTLATTAAPRPVFTATQAITGLVTMALALSIGVAASVGSPPSTAAVVEPTGDTTRVAVSASGMRFTPDVIHVPAGDRLVVVLTNDDPTTSHDLVIGTASTPRLRPGETAELDAGVIGADVEGWCSVAGHRQMGMVLQIVVEGAPAGDPGAEAPTDHPIDADPDAQLSTRVDPVLPPLTDETVREYTFTVTEVPLEVAPGLWQTRWTFNGGSVGPVLHGRVGDVFEITLVNDGSLGHSIDFHAGALAPDRPMRTIAPGESLVYRFTANRAGMWMYHCSTAPVSTHIAAGMHGGVIIEPDGLPAVDHSYVLVQSEVFLANQANSSEDAQEVDSAKVSAEQPDRVVFNGVANQYDQFPFEVQVGERVRFWVLAAGPNRALSFHVIGGQFDTVWTEGTYTLNRGVGQDGATDGGAQVLPLLPAQGGFAELTFDEAGHYPVVNHIMVDAERGAHGMVEVT